MGCLHSNHRFIMNEDVEGQGQNAMEVFLYIGLTVKDVDMMYLAFWDIDADNSGTIRAVELYAYFNIEVGAFENHVFGVFDEDHSGVLNFMEFVCSMWNLLTLSDTDLGILAYLMKDPTGTMRIRYNDVKEVMEILHKRKVEASPALQLIYNSLRKNFPAEISLAEFCKFTTQNISVLSPLLILQLKLRKQIIGERYWTRMAAERKANPELGQVNFIKKLQHQIKTKNDLFRNRTLHAEQERSRLARRGLGAGGDGRDNVTRKESILLGVFGLKQPSARIVVSTAASDENTSENAVLNSSPNSKEKMKPSNSSSKKLNRGEGVGSSGSSKFSNNTGSSRKERPGSASPLTGAASKTTAGDGKVRRRRSLMKPNLTRGEDSTGSPKKKKDKK